MPTEIRQLAAEWLHDPVNIQVAAVSTPAEKVKQSVFFVEPKQKPFMLSHFLKQTPHTRTLVFSRTKHGADKIVKHLNRDGIRAEAIHGNKSQGARQRVLQQFKSQQPPVLVATDIAARGLDIDEVSHVVKKVIERLKKPVEIHCHQDFGLGVANTISALAAGSSVAHTTVTARSPARHGRQRRKRRRDGAPPTPFSGGVLDRRYRWRGAAAHATERASRPSAGGPG